MIQAIRNIQHKALKPYATDNKGSATIEFVTTLPLVLVAFVFAFEFSRLFWAHHIATNNVRSATRYLARAPLAEPYLTEARNIARTGDPDTSTGAYDWMAAIADSNIDIQTNHETFTDTDFRVDGQVIRIQMDVPFTFSTVDFFNSFTGDALTLNIIEEARHIGE